jgi:diguanylate cyclase (GGDEF)-like protein
MGVLENMRIRAKLSIALGIALALIVGVGLFGIVELRHVNNTAKDIRNVWLPKIERLDDMKRAVAEHRLLATDRMQTTNFRRIAVLAKRLEQTQEKLQRAEAGLRSMNNTTSEQELLTEYQRHWEAYQSIFRTQLQRLEIGESAAAQADFNERALAAAAASEEQLDRLIEFAKQQMARAARDADATYRLALTTTVVAILLGVLLAGGVIFWTSRNVTVPLIRISEAMRRLTVGDQSVVVEAGGARKDEIGVLIDAVRGYRESLVRSGKLAEAVETERERLHAAVSNMPIGLCMFDAERRLTICNRQYAEIYKLPHELTRPGTPLRDILRHRLASEFSGPSLERYVNDLMEGDALKHSNRHIVELANGRTLSIITCPLPDGGVIGTHEDISEMRRAEAQIRHMARHDALTDLPNRLSFKERIEEALLRVPRGEIFAVLCLDLDRFKSVNDTLGHPIGDELLKQVADRLRTTLRPGDMAARFGGDEFAIVQTGGAQPNDATSLARRIIEMLSAPYSINEQEIVVGVSIGIAIAPADGDSAEQLLKNADMALYRAKSDGRGVYRFFEPEMDARMQARRIMEIDLRRALLQREFELFYQPVINAETSAITSFEALVRWHHPRRGLIAPSEFIPLAEEIGAIVPLGEWVLRQACADAAQWPGSIKVAVNLSPAQFKSKKLLESVVSALAASQLPPSRLELEITESVLMIEQETTLAILHQLRALGVSIAMDDFGTGYSSLSYLRSFPFDKIKIDGSFVRNIAEEASSLAIVRAVTGLSTSLGMTATAEGVETKQQFDRVLSEGCKEIQGFFISEPQPARKLADLIAAHSKRVNAAA